MRGIFALIIASAVVLQTSNAGSVSDDQCPGWKLHKKKASEDGGKVDTTRRDMLLDAGFEIYVKNGSNAEEVFQETGEEYAFASIMTFVPSILLLTILYISCLPVWIIFGCLENCWYKKRKEPKTLVLPCVLWGIWLLVFVVLAIVIGVAQLSFKKFSDGVAGSVCDIDGSLGAVSDWFIDLAWDIQALSLKVSGFLEEGRNDIFDTVKSLTTNIDTVDDTLSLVLKNINLSSAAITVAFSDYGLDEEISLPVDQLQKQYEEFSNKNKDFQDMIKDAEGTVDKTVDEMKAQIQTFPDSLNRELQNASRSISKMRRDLFAKGDISFPGVPVLMDEGLQDATLVQAVAKATNALQTLVVLMYIPVFIAAPVLLCGGIAVILVFMSCRENKTLTCCACCASKCGCALLWLGLTVTLWLSIVFLLLGQAYTDTCSIVAAPEFVIDYAASNDAGLFDSLTTNLPKSNISDFKVDNIIQTAKQCLSGSAYRGPSLVKTMGVNLSFVDELLNQGVKSFDPKDAVDLSALDDVLDKARAEIANAIAKSNSYKLGAGFLSTVEYSCNKCLNFSAPFSYFGEFQDESLDLYGEACDTACEIQPVPGCTAYNPALIYPEFIVVEDAGGKRTIRLPTGEIMEFPSELVNIVEKNGNAIGGNNSKTNACASCKNKTCDMESLAGTINDAIDGVIGNLTLIDDVIVKTNASIRQSLDGIGDMVKTVIDKSIGALGDTLNSVECSLVGDIYNTVVRSVCDKGLNGFLEYAWSFVWCALLGLVLIICTILLNLFVGLREFQNKKGGDFDLPRARIELSVQESYSVPQSPEVLRQRYSEAAPEMPYVPEAVPAVESSPVHATGEYNKDQYVVE